MRDQVQTEQMRQRIEELKKERNAVILAHNYQVPEVQDLADFSGDSLELAKKAAAIDEADVIVFCGVDFMAETAKILSPAKTVLLPVKEAGCPLAAMIDGDQLREMKAKHPGAKVVCYVNSTAEVKAESDVCCTSSNAVNVVNALDAEEVIFVPDGNLASWVAKHTDKKIIPWRGHCITHHRVVAEDVRKVREAYPDAPIVVHPECRPEVAELADHVTSTSGILRYAREAEAKELIIGTEVGLLHRLKKENPDKTFYLLAQGMICPNMKKITGIDLVLESLEKMQYEIDVPEEIRKRALAAVERMVKIG